MKDTDKAYLAGIIDGEGSIGIDNHAGHRTPSVRITITNTNMNMLAELKALWGGSLTTRRIRVVGWKASSDLLWGGSLSTGKILRAIKPYLKAKREQCRVALQFNKTVNKRYAGTGGGVPLEIQEYRQELRKQMLELNKRGTS